MYLPTIYLLSAVRPLIDGCSANFICPSLQLMFYCVFAGFPLLFTFSAALFRNPWQLEKRGNSGHIPAIYFRR